MKESCRTYMYHIKFADDTKLCARVNNEKGAKAVRGDLEKTTQMVEGWEDAVQHV